MHFLKYMWNWMFLKLSTYLKRWWCISRYLQYNITIVWAEIIQNRKVSLLLQWNTSSVTYLLSRSERCSYDIRASVFTTTCFVICAARLTSDSSSRQLCGSSRPAVVETSAGGCFSSWSLSSRAGAQSAKLARWVWLISINCGNATQPLAALCRNNQIITYTLSQRGACSSGRAVEDRPLKGVRWQEFCHFVLYSHYCISIYSVGF